MLDIRCILDLVERQLADKYILESTVEITEKTKVKNEEYVKTKEFWKEYGVPLRF